MHERHVSNRRRLLLALGAGVIVLLRPDTPLMPSGGLQAKRLAPAPPIPPIANRIRRPTGQRALLPADQRADRVLVEKQARRLTLFRGNQVIGVYRVALGFTPQGDKTHEGDGKTPLGFYRIDRRNQNSAYFLSLGIDYPRADQRRQAKAQGRDPGGDIFIHGQPNSRTDPKPLSHDWTAGCVAVSNAEIEEIWRHVALGTVVEIRP